MRTNKGHIDGVLLLSAILIALAGIAFLYSATYDKANEVAGLGDMVMKQCMWVAIGLLFVLLIVNSNYIKMLDWAYLFYAINLAALVFILLFAEKRFGAKRWIDIGMFSVQPSEFIKITLMFVLAAFLGERRERIGELGNFILALLLAMPAFLLVFIQPDLGTAMILVPILFSILFICGERVKYMVSLIAVGLCSLPFAWHLLKDYQKTRLLVFLNPDLDPLGAGYTIIQSKIAIGSGGVFGKGWLSGTQSYLKFLPERHTDFIFSVIGEEWGYLGAIALLSLYAILIWRGVKIIASAGSIYARAIATGVVTLISFQVLVNISMTIGLMPVVGFPLPFISYGGSGMLTAFIGVGLLLRAGRES